MESQPTDAMREILDEDAREYEEMAKTCEQIAQEVTTPNKQTQFLAAARFYRSLARKRRALLDQTPEV